MKKSIIATYPDFENLPNVIKQLLLASERFFFEETTTAPMGPRDGRLAVVTFTVMKSKPPPKVKLALHPWARN